MSAEGIVAGLFGVCGVGVTWWVNTIWGRVAALEAENARQRQELNDFRLRVAEDYVSQNRLEKMLDPIMNQLRHINDKLDDKADKL